MVRNVDRRSQSNAIAIVLIVGIVAVSSVLILLAGAVVIEDSEQQAETARVENSFRQLDERIDSVAYGSRGQARTDLALADRNGGTADRQDTGRIVVEVQGPGGSAELVNNSTGTILYTDDERTIGYQSSAVWRGNGNGTQMISAPGVEYAYDDGDDPTLKLLVTELRGDLDATTSTVAVERGPDSPRRNDVTEIDNQVVTIRITSRFYVGWGNYFEEVLESRVSYDHANDTVVIRVLPASLGNGIPAGIVQTTAAEDLLIRNTFGTDSYNSSQGPYSATGTNDGRVIAEGDILMEQQGEVQGEVVVGGNLTLQNQAQVEDDATVGNNLTFDNNQAEIGGDAEFYRLVNNTNQDATIVGNAFNRSISPAEDLVDLPQGDVVIEANRDIVSDNDNGATPRIDATDRLDPVSCSGGGCTYELDAGSYYLAEVDLNSNDELVLDATGGSIDVYVDGPVQFEQARVDVVGDGRVNIYVDSADPAADDLLLDRTSVAVPDDRSPQLWIWMRSNANALIRGGGGTDPDVDGVVYGASGDTATDGTQIRLRQGAEVFGAVVGDVDEVTQSAGVHFDRALLQGRDRVAGFPLVEWLHVLLRTAEVSTD